MRFRSGFLSLGMTRVKMRIVQKGPFVRSRSVQYQTLKVCFDQSCKRLCMYESLCAWLTVDRSRMRSYLGFTTYAMIS